jgi:flagella basal body P-ring formation protein FlgA
MRRTPACLIIAAALAAALPAMAGTPVDLRPDVVSEDGKVTLGDLFDDAGRAADVVVARAQPDRVLVLDASRVQTLARAEGLDWSNEKGLRRIIVQPGSGEPDAPPATVAKASVARRGHGGRTLAYVHTLEAGQIVRAEDLTWSRSADAPLDAPEDPDAIIGMAARHALREGAAVALHDVAPAQVIHKDEMISVSFAADGLVLTLQAKALDNAVVGQSLSVVNVASKKVIQAVASGPGQAVVGPEADTLKANSRSSLSRYALR